MKPLSHPARHEAAHAVVAAHFGLPMCEVTIVPSVIEGREVGGCVRFEEVPEDRVKLAEFAVSALAARVEIDRFQWSEEIPESFYRMDDSRVREIAKALNVQDERYEGWRGVMLETTAKILNVACISEAIEAVACELDKHNTITPEAVMGLLLLFRGAYPKEMQDAPFDAALLERAQQIRHEEPAKPGEAGLWE